MASIIIDTGAPVTTHNGIPSSHSSKTIAGVKNGTKYPIMRFGDSINCPTHGTTTITECNGNATDLDGKKIAREGDLTSCTATLKDGFVGVMVKDA